MGRKKLKSMVCDSHVDCEVELLSLGKNDSVTDRNSYISIVSPTTTTQSTRDRRGISTIELSTVNDGHTCLFANFHTFDTYESGTYADQLADYINTLPLSTVVLGASYDDASKHLNDNAKSALLSIGVNATTLEFRGKLAFIAQIGRPLSTIAQVAPRYGDSLKIRVLLNGSTILILVCHFRPAWISRLVTQQYLSISL